MNTIQNNTVQAQATVQTQRITVKADAFEEFGTVEVTGNFRGYWRDVPRKDANGNAVVGADGKQVIDRQFKISRSVKYTEQVTQPDGSVAPVTKVVRQSAWLTEADAKAHSLEDGVKYRITMTVGEELVPSATNGKPDRNGIVHADEFVFADATIISVER